jgi:pantetheine-phosphate adenylyltransferase
MKMTRFKTVGLGGTFDELHKGHRALLMKAFEVGERVIIGISSDKFAKDIAKPHLTASYSQRTKELKNFLNINGLQNRAKIIAIDDVYGGVLQRNSPIEALVVSQETKPTAVKINRRRRELGLRQIKIVVIHMIQSESNTPISTTQIRRGEIDREGNIIKSNEEKT